MLIIAYKLVVVAVALFLGWVLLQMRYSGQYNRAFGYSTGVVAEHKEWARMVIILTFALVGLVKLDSWLRGTPTQRDAVYWAHLACVAVFVICLPILFKYTGRYSRTVHFHTAYTLMAAYAGMLIFGIPRLLGWF